MDAVGFGKAVIFGISEGGAAAIVFAATRPERTRALILTGTFPFTGSGWDDVDRDPAEMRARLVPELGEDYTPSTQQLARWQELSRAARSAWGSGAALKGLLPSVRSIRQLAMLERMSASPGMARATIEAAFRIDVRPILPTITAPTLVIHAREDPIPVQGGRYVADHIPGARLLEVDGADHAPWFTDPDTIMTGIEDFLTGSHAAPSQSHRALRTVLFTDMVASTQYATARRLWPLRRHPFVDDLAHRPLAAGDVGSNSYRGLRGRQVVAGILLCREPHPRLFPLTGIRTDPRVDRNLVAHNRSAAGAVGHRDLADLRRQLLSSTHFADAFSRGGSSPSLRHFST